jgi:acyl-CoA synthetase (AMP-forming)/AMP-acid ligase II
MSPELKEYGDFPEGKIKHAEELDCSGEYPKPGLRPEDLAFIQFSSGSTGDPKGIMLTHANLMVNMDAIRIGLDSHYPDNIGNWMPLFHDMGLIGYHLTPLYSISFQFQLETVEFIMNPGLWINMMSLHKITVTGCTNFALALVLRYFNRKKPSNRWDLSSMKAMLNGAEPISVPIMQEFTGSLLPFGFRSEAMMPVYGLAEATLAVSFTPLMKPSVIKAFDAALLDRERVARPMDPADPSARLLSGVGVALNDVKIRIVDETGRQVPEGISGHIRIKGPSVTRGYYNRPDATAAAFHDEWLRTGDIGFFYGEHLFISGRYKDIIFKNGRNYFANDLEAMACTLEGVSHGKICFGAHTSRETGHDIVIAFAAGVPDTQADDMFQRLRALLRSNLGITVDELVQIKSNEMPKTSSGKLQRFKLMQRYINGDFAGRIFSRKSEGIS